MIKIFTIHYKKLIDRKENIINQLEKYNLQTEFIDRYDRDLLLDKNLSIFNLSQLNKANIAISLSHFYAYNNIANNVNLYNYALILLF